MHASDGASGAVAAPSGPMANASISLNPAAPHGAALLPLVLVLLIGTT